MQSPEEPIQVIFTPNQKGLNKISWENDGRFIVCGSLNGSCYLYDVGGIVATRAEDNARFIRFIRELLVES